MMLLDRMRLFWSELASNQRILAVALAGGLILLMTLVMVWSARPEYAVLYGNLEIEDAGAVLERLRAEKISYKLRDEGRTVLVPARSVHEIRLSIAGDGLPSAGTGYEILDTNKLGWTDFVQKLQNRRALEGEIARTVQTLQEIRSARVHLVMPEPSLYSSEEKPATASVVLQIKHGTHLNPGQVRGIVHLVSSAVEGLQTENVTLLDSAGNLLSRPADDALAGVSNEQMMIVQSIESELTRKVEGLLDTVLGRGKSVTRISVEMDFEQSETTIESFDSENPVVRSENRSEATTADGGMTQTETTNFEISRRTERTSSPAGSIKRLTASVFVDGVYQGSEDGALTYAPRDPVEMAKFENIIKNSIGFDAGWGERLTVENIAFDNSVGAEPMSPLGAPNRMDRYTGLVGKVGGLVLIAILLFFLVRVLRRTTILRPGGGDLTDAISGQTAGHIGYASGHGPEAGIGEKYGEGSHSEQLRKRVVSLGKQKPEAVSRLVRTWLREEQA